jgi:hypothetical protein
VTDLYDAVTEGIREAAVQKYDGLALAGVDFRWIIENVVREEIDRMSTSDLLFSICWRLEEYLEQKYGVKND